MYRYMYKSLHMYACICMDLYMSLYMYVYVCTYGTTFVLISLFLCLSFIYSFFCLFPHSFSALYMEEAAAAVFQCSK